MRKGKGLLDPVTNVAVHNTGGAQYSEQNDRAQNGYDKSADTKGADGDAEQYPGQPATDQSADDANDYVGQAALLAVGVHDHRCDPSG